MSHPSVKFDKKNNDIVLSDQDGDFNCSWDINRTTTAGTFINVGVVNQMLERAYEIGQADGSKVLRRKISAAMSE